MSKKLLAGTYYINQVAGILQHLETGIDYGKDFDFSRLGKLDYDITGDSIIIKDEIDGSQFAYHYQSVTREGGIVRL